MFLLSQETTEPKSMAPHKESAAKKLLRSTPEYRLKARCRAAIQQARTNGTLVQQPCERCGSREHIHAHHEDYNKPLEVIWLCRPCHRALHRERDHGDRQQGELL
jgi:hypothetical protein